MTVLNERLSMASSSPTTRPWSWMPWPTLVDSIQS